MGNFKSKKPLCTDRYSLLWLQNSLVRIHTLDKKRICTKFAHRKYVEKIYKMISKDDKCYICIPSYHGVVISRQIWYLPSFPLSYSSVCILQLANSLFIAIPLTYLHNKNCSSKLRRMQSVQTFLMSCDRICQMVNQYSELRWIRIEYCHLKRKWSDKHTFSIGQSEKYLNTTSGLVCRFM